MAYLLYNHLSSCILPVKNSVSVSHTLTNLQSFPVVLDSCVGDGCDEGSLMFFGRDIFGAHEMRRLVNSEFINFSRLTVTQLFRSQSRKTSTLLILNLIEKMICVYDTVTVI